MNEPVAGRDGRLHMLALVFALTFPTLATSLYFLILVPGDGKVSPVMQACYTGGKVVQFTFPVLFLWYWTGRLPRPGSPRLGGRPMALGLGFGLATAAAMVALYHGAFAGTPMLEQTPRLVQGKLHEVGMDGLALFLVTAVFVSLAHSLMEEYYWRWFVFGQLRQRCSRSTAILISSIGFTAHHVIILYVYLPGYLGSAVIPFSVGIAVGGAVWAWLYERYDTIYPAWFSHAIIDGAIFVIGYDLLNRSG